jgi:hypothetical protein
MTRMLNTAIAALILLGAGSASAGLEPGPKCHASKAKVAGAYYACRQKADATAVAKNTGPDYTKCVAKFTEKWLKAETDGAGACPDDIIDIIDADVFIAAQASAAAQLVAGTYSEAACGDDQVNVAGEHCDGAAMDGKTCASFGLFGTLACTAGCELDLSGCTPCPAGSLSYEGSCWLLGALGSDCDAACATLGLTYDTATMTIAGSAGTNDDCLALLYAFGAPGGDLDNAGGLCTDAPAGCMVLPEFGWRSRCGTPATTSTYSHPDARRVCACQ